MDKITLNTTTFSDQLGLYDFFNVLIYGITFIGGLCVLNENIYNFIWNNMSFQKGLGIVLLVYITGMILQEIGSIIDYRITNIRRGMNCSILKGDIDENNEKKRKKQIIRNPIVLQQYRNRADKILGKHIPLENEERFNNEEYNGYVFSICQYYVSVKEKDKKSEKLHALFSMSISLMCCFFLLFICALFSLWVKVDMSIKICSHLGITGNSSFIDKIILMLSFLAAGFLFLFRAKRTMKNFLIILLGTYNAIIDAEENDKKQNIDINGQKQEL